MQLVMASLALGHIFFNEGFNLGLLLRGELSHSLLGTLVMTLLAFLLPFFSCLLALLRRHFFPFCTLFFDFGTFFRAHFVPTSVLLARTLAVSGGRAVIAVFAENAVYALPHSGFISLVVVCCESSCTQSSHYSTGD